MTRILLAGATSIALLAGCAHSGPSPAALSSPDHDGAMMAMCPMGVPGTTVVAVDDTNGSTITFTTTDQVAELQRRVHSMVAMHNQRDGDGGMKHEGMMSGEMMGDGQGMSGMMMPPSHATVIDLESGARVKVMPIEPAELQKLQASVRLRTERMQKDGCGMMGKMHAG